MGLRGVYPTWAQVLGAGLSVHQMPSLRLLVDREARGGDPMLAQNVFDHA